MSKVVCVVDANCLSREGLLHVLGRCDLDVRYDVAAVEQLAGTSGPPPDLVLLDGDEAPARTLRDATWLRDRFPTAKIVVLSNLHDTDVLLAYVASPLDGIISKDISTLALGRTLQLALAGERVFPCKLFAMALQAGGHHEVPAPRDPRRVPALSEREIEVLEFLVDGESNKTIANHLGIAEATIKVHLKSILRKIQVRNRTQAAIWALEQGLSGIRRAALAA